MDVQMQPQVGRQQIGGGGFAFREMVEHMSPFREFYAHFMDFSRGVAGLEDCQSRLTHLKAKKPSAEKFPDRHFPET